MIFVDTNVFMYAVGGPHPLQAPAREFFLDAHDNATPLYTSAEVVQELAHAYLPRREDSFDRAIGFVHDYDVDVWPLEFDDVVLARELHELHPHLSARDLCYLASCQRREIREIKTFDRAFAAVANA